MTKLQTGHRVDDGADLYDADGEGKMDGILIKALVVASFLTIATALTAGVTETDDEHLTIAEAIEEVLETEE